MVAEVEARTRGRTVVLLTDPPYQNPERFAPISGTDGKRTMAFEFDYDGQDVCAIVDEYLAGASTAMVFCGPSQVSRLYANMRNRKMSARAWVWVKACPPPAAPGNWWTGGFELAVFGHRPGAWFGDDRAVRPAVYHGDTLRAGNSEKCGHPTQKPLKLMRHLVRSLCPPGSVVVDPFCGSGSTLVAAAELGIDGIGVERDRGYLDMARERLDRVQPDLFGKAV